MCRQTPARAKAIDESQPTTNENRSTLLMDRAVKLLAEASLRGAAGLPR
jgi:hypothetical protein